jgi:bifunctional hydroxylase/dehydrase
MGFTARTLEVFDQRGLLPRFGPLNRSPGGHFGSVPVNFAVGGGEHASVTGVPQSRTVAVLEQWADELGVEIRRGHRVTGLTDHGDHVTVRAETTGGPVELSAAYLVGCDGGRSVVREAAGFGFPGTDATAELLLADVEGLTLPPLWSGARHPGGMLLAAPLGGGRMRIVVSEHGRAPQPRVGPPSFDEVAAAWQRVSGDDISTVIPVWVSSFGDAARQADTYRRGRVLLAGDAAHVHLPASGQGMNVSIQDAVNLGWKLGAVVTGRAGADLLDTYHAERHPVGAELLRNTRAQAVLFLGGPEMQPLRDILARVFGGDQAARLLAGLVSGLDIHYDLGEGDHPLLGRRLPPTTLIGSDARVVHSPELLHAGRGLLLDLGADPKPARIAAEWGTEVRIVTAGHRDDAATALAGVHAVLVRPDGYVAWVDGHGDLGTALHRWFGDPAAARPEGSDA